MNTNVGKYVKSKILLEGLYMHSKDPGNDPLKLCMHATVLSNSWKAFVSAL